VLARVLADDQGLRAASAGVTALAARTVRFRAAELERSGALATLDGTDGLLRATPELTNEQLVEFHARLLEAFGEARAELRAGYELGRALGGLEATTHGRAAAFPASLRRLLDPTRVVAVARDLASIETAVGPAASRAIFRGLELWCDFVARADDPLVNAAREAFRGQLRAWRALLLHQAVTRPLSDDSIRPVGQEERALEPKAGLREALDLVSLRASFPAVGRPDLDEVEAEALFTALTTPPPTLANAPATRIVPAAEAAEPPPRRSRARRLRRAAVEVGVVLLAAAATTLILRSFALETFYVPTGSMSPTIAPGDRILVNKLSSVRSDLHRGDIIVFKRVAADTAPPATPDLVKRIIGLPGDTVQADGSRILIDGKPLAEPWLPRLTGECRESAYQIPRTVVPPGDYFVMGDCRGDSYDSREWGTVPRSNVIGRVLLVIWQDGHPWLRGV